MSVTYGFYNSVNGDRKYDATQLSSLFDGLINDGVFASIGTCFAVEAAGGNTVNIGIGKAWFNKTWTLNDAILPLEAPVSEVLLDRIDAVVLEVDISERVNSIKFVEGVPSSSPVNPTLASGPTLFQYPLCYIYRPAGSTEITQAQITNMVGSEATPFITGILQTVNLDEWINSRLADYEYQTPIIDGTQIQLQKQSNTKILKFRLDADLSGGAITISLDGGATSKPLVDIDGVAVTKLPKGFVEVVEDAVNFTYAPKGKGASLDLEKVDAVVFSAESESYGGSIRSITSDDNFLYVGGSTTQRVYKLDKSDLSKVSESIDYGGAIYSITSDDDYLYVGGSTTQKVYKLNKSDLSKVAESESYGGTIYSITSDDDYLYVAGSTTQRVWKLTKVVYIHPYAPASLDLKEEMIFSDKSIDYLGTIYSITSDDDYLYVGGFTDNLSDTRAVWKLDKNLNKLAESRDYGGIYSIAVDDNYVYVGGGKRYVGDPNPKVWKLAKSNLNKVRESIEYGIGTEGYIYSIAVDDNYVYIGGSPNQRVWKLNKSDLSKVAESIDYGGTIYSIVSDDNFLYVGGHGSNKVWKLNKSDLSKVSESIDYGGSIRSITSDDNYIYVGGGGTQRVWKLDKSDLSKVGESESYGNFIQSITSDDNFIYVGGNTQKVWKLSKSDLSKVSESIEGYGGTIRSITSDDNFIYVGGYTTRRVRKLAKVGYLYKNLKLIAIGSV